MNSRTLRPSATKKSPIRLVCEPPDWAVKAHPPRTPGAKQAWGHMFLDPESPWHNWTACRWVCSRPIKGALFRESVTRYAVLHPSTKPARAGVINDFDFASKAERVRLKSIIDPRVKCDGGWQLSMFDDRGASGDIWGATPDEALNEAFGGRMPAYDARSWHLEKVIDASGHVYGRGDV